MNVKGKHYQTIWLEDNEVKIIDQRHLPHKFVIEILQTVDDVCIAIKDMHVRGAGLIGATAAWGIYIASKNSKSIKEIIQAGEKLIKTRPTAINLKWAVDRQIYKLRQLENINEIRKIAKSIAQEISNEDISSCKKIGEYGYNLIKEISEKKDGPVNILTHCNAGWLAFVDYGSATAPIYAAHEKGIKVHVWVDETRPRNQGSRLTAWELDELGIPHTIIADNVGGHLMQHGQVDLVIVGSDRTTFTGDVANKIGTYLKALAAKDNNIPFYVALPSTTFDWRIRDGVQEIPIEQRGDEEVKYAKGLIEDEIKDVLLAPKNSKAANFAFDVTPSRLITGLITERGICKPNEKDIIKLFPEYRNARRIA